MKIALCKANICDTKISDDRPHLTCANTSLFPDWLKSNGVRQLVNSMSLKIIRYLSLIHSEPLEQKQEAVLLYCTDVECMSTMPILLDCE